jgi:hypothetical protein
VRALATTLWPAHGGPCPAALADADVAHRHMRTGQFLEALRRGAGSAEAVAQAVYAGIPGVDLSLAAMQVRTHLAWMHDRGLARDTEHGWVAT